MIRTKLYRFWRNMIILFVTSLTFLSVQGQSSYILYGFDVVPQSYNLNPAFNSTTKVIVGFPALSNIEVSYLNTAGTFNDFFSQQNTGDSLFLDLSKVISQNHNLDHINISVNHDLLFIGFKIKKSFLSFGVKQHVQIHTSLPADLFKLAWNGNAPYIGQTLDLSTLMINEDHYIDYHLGLSIPVAKGLNFGFRIHLLQGLSNIYTANNQLQITTLTNDQNAYDITAKTNFLVNTAGLPDSTDFDPVEYLTNFDNLGYSLDLGIDYQINDQFGISASLLNMGSGNFKTKTRSFQSQEDSIRFNGLNLDFVNSDNPTENIGDSLSDMFHVSDFSQNYKTKIPKRLLVSGHYYSKNHKNKASILFSGLFYPDYFQPAVSVALSRDLSKNFSIKVNYTYIKYAPVNVGLAFALNLKPFQLYVYTDNVLGVKWYDQKMIQAGFGLNIRIPDQISHIKRIPVEDVSGTESATF